MDKKQQLSNTASTSGRTVNESPDQDTGIDLKGAAQGVIILIGVVFGIVILSILFVWASPSLRLQAPLFMTVLLWGALGVLALFLISWAFGRHFRMVKEEGRKDFNVKRKFAANENGAYPSLFLPESKTFVQPTPGAVKQVVPESVHLAPNNTNHNDPNAIVKLLEFGRTRVIEEPPPMDTRVIVPPAYDLMDVVHTPAFQQGMFLGRIGLSREVSVNPESELCHGAFNASTGGGKTVIIRGLEPQLLNSGYEVIHADPKFTVYDRTYNLDYRPTAKALLAQGCISGAPGGMPHLLVAPPSIRAMLQWLATVELMRRNALYLAGRGNENALLYVFLEELAYLNSSSGKDKLLAQHLDQILELGRSLNIKLFTSAQNFQKQNSGVNTGTRENFESAWHLGGDSGSGAALLDMKEKELKTIVQQNAITLGKGIAFFRNNSQVPNATVMRAGMASNAYVYHMLGRADDFVLPDEVTGRGTRDALGTRSSGNLGVFQGDVSQHPNIPSHGISALVERRDVHPVSRPTSHLPSSFLPKSDDKLLPADLHEKLIRYYQLEGTVIAALEKMGNTNSRYRRHAKFIVDQHLKREA